SAKGPPPGTTTTGVRAAANASIHSKSRVSAAVLPPSFTTARLISYVPPAWGVRVRSRRPRSQGRSPAFQLVRAHAPPVDWTEHGLPLFPPASRQGPHVRWRQSP